MYPRPLPARYYRLDFGRMRTVRRFPLRIRSVLCADTQAGAGVSPAAQTAKIGFILRRTVGSAVMRNRFKRVFRHQLGASLAQLPSDAWQQRAVYVVTWEGPTPLTEAAIGAAVAVWRQWLERATAPVLSESSVPHLPSV